MTHVDWGIVGFVVFTALVGLRRGLIGTVLSLAGLAAGAVVGARVAPHFLAHTTASHYSSLVGLGGAIVGAIVLQVAARMVAGFFRAGLRLAPPLHLLDSLGGLVAGAAWGLVLVWVAGAVVTQIPDHSKWKTDAHTSKVLHRLNAIAPPHDVLKLRASLFERF
jgi:membrane protein required for colicin V production